MKLPVSNTSKSNGEVYAHEDKHDIIESDTHVRMASAPSADSSRDDALKDIVKQLTSAIQSGDNEAAARLVALLTQQRLKLDINVSDAEQNQQAQDKPFSLKVHVEDRLNDGCNIELMVKASDTIADLKKQVMLKHNFPMEVQRWIIGRKIHTDRDKLRSCGVKGPGHTVYLYLVTARSVGLNQKAYETQRNALLIDPNGDQWPPQLGYNPDASPVELSAPSGLMVNLNLPDQVDQQLKRQSSSQISEGSARIQEMLMLHSPNSSTHNISSGSVPPNAGRVSAEQVVQEEYYRPPQSPKNAGAVSFNQLGEYLQTEPGTSPSNPHPLSGAASSPSGSVTPPLEVEEGWNCPACTLLNLPTRPGCEMCSTARPADYQVPANYVMTPREVELMELEKQQERLTRESTQEEALANFQQLMMTYDLDLVPNSEPFQCPICFDDIAPGDGIVLRDCLHTFCGECLQGAINHCDEAILRCPYQDDTYSCESVLQEREVKALVSQEAYLKYLQRGLDQAESQTANSYHCKSSDCRGWCIYEDDVNFFTCPICRKNNCLTCKAIHEGVNCKQYQDSLNERAKLDKEAQQTRDMLQRLVAEGEAMHCPRCQVIVQKKGGCDWIKCSICKLEICWVTKGPRWGPKGEGDTSGGCRCRIGGKKCHTDCINCH